MLTFIEFLEELERNNQTVVLPADDLERLVQKFGPDIRQMAFGIRKRTVHFKFP